MYAPPSPRQRAAAALAAGTLVGAMVLALAAGFAPRWQHAIAPALTAIDLIAPTPTPIHPPPPKPPPPRPTPESAPTGSPAPRNLRNKASPVFAPPIPVPLVVPPPIVAAPLPDSGNAAQTGASDLPGPGTGAGGIGQGNGGGGSGGNGNGGAVKGPRQISGKLSYRDLPQGLIAPGAEASVAIRYTVTPTGAVTNCRIDQSSGFPALDVTACRLIEQRFRFRPAQDRAGNPVSATIAEEHTWVRSPQED